jgi:hypothetical protein
LKDAEIQARAVLRNLYFHPDPLHCKFFFLQDSWIGFYQTFLGLGLGKLFPARESLVSDILAGEGNTAKLFFTV